MRTITEIQADYLRFARRLDDPLRRRSDAIKKGTRMHPLHETTFAPSPPSNVNEVFAKANAEIGEIERCLAVLRKEYFARTQQR